MSLRAFEWASSIRHLNFSDECVLRAIANNYDEEFAFSILSLGELASILSLSKATILISLNRLEGRGLIRRQSTYSVYTRARLASKYSFPIYRETPPRDVEISFDPVSMKHRVPTPLSDRMAGYPNRTLRWEGVGYDLEGAPNDWGQEE